MKKCLLDYQAIQRFGESLTSNSEGSIKRVYLNSGPCTARPTLVNIKSNEPLYCPFTVSVSKPRDGFNSIHDL